VNWRAIWLTAALGGLAVSYGLLTRRDDDDTATVAKPRQPGYYLEDAIIIETQPDGSPRMKLSARLIQQNARDDSIALQTVRVDYLAVKERHWLLTADHGYIPPTSQRIQFRGDVEIQEVGADNTTPRVTTERLELDMDKNIARTDSPVQIAFGPHTLTARGLWADLKSEKLRLESQVNGQFSPR
jgi:LPS export ABC transporter protein LptC